LAQRTMREKWRQIESRPVWPVLPLPINWLQTENSHYGGRFYFVAWQHCLVRNGCFKVFWTFSMGSVHLQTSFWSLGVTAIGIDIHQTLHVLEPASMALPLSCQAPSFVATQCLHPWHLSETFKCLFVSLSGLPAQPGKEGMTFGKKEGWAVPSSFCLLQLSVWVFSQHIKI
jgi:hypothetical protein